jgi:hypothetical protein
VRVRVKVRVRFARRSYSKEEASVPRRVDSE